MNQLRVILVTGNNVEHRYVANKLARELPLTGIIVDHGKVLTRAARLHQLYRRYTLRQLVSRASLAFMTRIWQDKSTIRQTMLSLFGTENCLEFSWPELIHHVSGINTQQGVHVVSSLRPDVILVFGTSMVGTKILSLARILALNMHTGISPFYRGSDCAFWPLYNEEPHMLGATVHECTMQLDGGRIFGTARVKLHPDDCQFSVFARCIMAGADLYAKKVRELIERGLDGTPQDYSAGREYKAYMKGVRAEWKVRRSVKAGLIRRFALSGDNTAPPAAPEV